jgi:hypothetical protein
MTLLADLVVALHLAFLGFVVLGGLLVLRWPGAFAQAAPGPGEHRKPFAVNCLR